jgi:hypothetical protein
MSKRKKVSVLVTHDRTSFRNYRKIVNIASATCFPTGSDSSRAWGVISLSGSGAGAEVGKAYLCIDTAGTGSAITD